MESEWTEGCRIEHYLTPNHVSALQEASRYALETSSHADFQGLFAVIDRLQINRQIMPLLKAAIRGDGNGYLRYPNKLFVLL